MKITLVKKILENGELCAKCLDVQERLEKADQMKLIDEVLIADERDPLSPGLQLATALGVERAPFFVVEEEGAAPQVYTSYLKFNREVLKARVDEKAELKELMDNNDLDFL